MQPTYDKNLIVDIKTSAADVVFYDIRKAPFTIYGLYNPTTEDTYKRVPDDIGLNTNEGVATLYLHTAGGRVRFSTDSSYVAIRATYDTVGCLPHMPMTNSAGFDIYEDFPDTASIHRGTFAPPYDMKHGYESRVDLKTSKQRYFTVNFPSYNHPATIEIGIREGSTLGEGLKYRNKRPIVYYGSSITQGGCASRPGNIYQNIICRSTNLDYINLGFSGSGKAEDIIVDYMASLDCSVFVSDYDHNAPTPEYLLETHCKMYKKIREAHPDLPYIMISKPDFKNGAEKNILRKKIIYDTYTYARENGDRKVYFIDGEYFFKGKHEQCCTVDCCHPNDLGFSLMAEKIEACIRDVMTENDILN